MGDPDYVITSTARIPPAPDTTMRGSLGTARAPLRRFAASVLSAIIATSCVSNSREKPEAPFRSSTTDHRRPRPARSNWSEPAHNIRRGRRRVRLFALERPRAAWRNVDAPRDAVGLDEASDHRLQHFVRSGNANQFQQSGKVRHPWDQPRSAELEQPTIVRPGPAQTRRSTARRARCSAARNRPQRPWRGPLLTPRRLAKAAAGPTWRPNVASKRRFAVVASKC